MKGLFRNSHHNFWTGFPLCHRWIFSSVRHSLDARKNLGNCTVLVLGGFRYDTVFQDHSWVPLSVFRVKIAISGSLKRATEWFLECIVSNFIEACKNITTVSYSKHLKNICAHTRRTDVIPQSVLQNKISISWHNPFEANRINDENTTGSPLYTVQKLSSKKLCYVGTLKIGLLISPYTGQKFLTLH